MTTPTKADTELAHEAIALVRRWLQEAAKVPVSGSAAQLAGVLKDPDGLRFAVGFVDGVVRPEDVKVSARALAALAPGVPRFLPAPLRAAVRVGGKLAPTMPGVVVPIARRVLRRMVGHLIVDAGDAKLGRAIKKIKGRQVRLNVNLLGEAVLGRGEATRRLRETERLLARPDVDYVSIKVSSTVAPHSPWAFEEAVDDIAEELTPLFTLAAKGPHKFVNLDMEEYKDLDLTIAVFTRLLDRPEFERLEAGIVLQAYLPDALAAMTRLQQWSAARRARGGAGIKVRLVKGANLPMERVEATVHGWPLATWGSKQDTDTNYKRVLEYALRPEHVRNVRLGVAGHNLFDVAYAWLLAGRRGVRDGIEFEMLLGMAEGQAEVVRREVGGLLLYTPVVRPEQFDVAIAYLIRRLEEGASTENFMSAVFELDSDPQLFAREQQRFLASLEALHTDTVPAPHRVPDRFAAVPVATAGHFENTPDTDPAVETNRDLVRSVLSRVPSSTLGIDTIKRAHISDLSILDAALEGAASAAEAWGKLSGAERSTILHAIGVAIEERRADLIEVMAAETGKTADQADPEVSEAADFAHFYAETARELDTVDGATPVPARLTLVTPPWNFPVAIPAGSLLAALAAGSAVAIKPAGPAERCGALLAEIIRPVLPDPRLLTLIQVDEQQLGRQLVAHPLVDRVVLTGAYETAELFRSFRADLPLLAETSGKNAIIVTPSADLDLAVKDVVASAFGHAGQKCSAASLVVLVGSVARSQRFRTQLLDAASSLTVGYPADARTQVGPVIEPATGKLLDGLTKLGPGESWLLAPRRLDDDGRLWSPGIRDGVRRGSEYHKIEYFGPVLGVMTASTLDEAIDIVNEVDYGLTSGLHSLDPAELRTWLDRIQAGNLYVNRGITGAIVRRQPFGGWKRSAVGPGTKAGGPNYLVGLSAWEPGVAAHTAEVTHPAVRRLVAAAGDEFVTRAAGSDALAWQSRFAPSDVSGLWAERNVLRYLPVPVTVRLAAGASPASLARVVAAGLLAESPMRVSVAEPLPAALSEAIGAVTVEDDATWLAGLEAGRIRLIGGTAADVTAATGGRPDLAVWAGPVTEAGRVELLPFLHEQAVSITAHRFGNPDPLASSVL
ncbi:bifunctional proline dehydrogenase/L-glutamate gamma-semialdehyde dehydrogenase [Actinoplanes sp. TBRC 11911]|uniref:proline dehydrogenase family protein n=1 Tax=Actinoplanes sp. TBRC 11911 TaxID=2729386 RepID=UPI00145E2B83|nr:bifunctional proline dehydrogenase/L-glutamate gamma-semialdehyde dehydrogenase [Actinoplanes sp. TBRC 11911]NMO56170.1 bifunctional proline dehydrogenase/L-glutamate gamma-semialdehyde dehydrogenase [Actinoplanes sp. TBRC 11911]